MASIEINEVIDKYNIAPVGKKAGGEQGYKCPVGGHRFDVNPTKNMWHCFHQCTGCLVTGGGAYALWSMLNGKDGEYDKDDYIEFCKTFEKDSDKHAEAVKAAQEERESVPEDAEKADDETCDRAYTALLEKCKLTRAHRADLQKRGFSDDDIVHFGFKSIPQVGLMKLCSEMAATGIVMRGVPGFYIGRGGKWTLLTSGSGYFIPYKNAKGQIVGLQVRYDIDIHGLEGKELSRAKQRRYRWVSSSGVEAGSSMSLVPYLGEPTGNDKAVYVTEGGLKAMAAATLSKRWFAAIPGINCYTVYASLLSYLKEQGITKIVDAWDTDRKENESVMNSIKKLYEMAQAEGFEVIQWPAFMNGNQKGCDDFLMANREKAKSKGKSCKKEETA